MTHTKECSDCKIEKPISDFYKRPNYQGTKTVYYKSMCKECAKDRAVAWSKANPEKFNAYQKKYNAKNKPWLKYKRN